jgi:hypothetical protein
MRIESRNMSIITKHIYYVLYASRGSAVGIGTDYGIYDRGRGVRAQVRSIIFSSAQSPDSLWDPPNLLMQWVSGGLPPEVKRPGTEADHSRGDENVDLSHLPS